MIKKFPNFFVVGAAKCGTTALYHFLSRHPEVYMSPIKEPNHFCTDIKPEEFTREYQLHEARKNLDLNKYLAGPMTEKHFDYFVIKLGQYELLFKNVTSEKAIGEISNSYLFSKVAAINIKNKVPEAKIVIILRNPVDRIFSHYLANLRDGKTFRPFMEEIQLDFNKSNKGWWKSHCYFEMGLYFEQVKRYVDIFGTEQVKVLWYEDLKNDFTSLVENLFSFLDVSSNLRLTSDEKYNVSMEPRNKRFIYYISKLGIKKPLFNLIPASYKTRIKNSFFKKQFSFEMNADERQYLSSFYEKDVQNLGRLLQKDLSHWR
ncbi:MAG: sulfotransferase domain-containing protein [Bacteroidia bacterium]